MLLPRSTPYVSGETGLFHDLVAAGETNASVTLPPNLRHFLISCLIEHMRDPDIVFRILALDFLESPEHKGRERAVALKRSGDASLILAGLFPERALRLRVSRRYFRLMGQAFFGMLSTHLSSLGDAEAACFYNEVAQRFERLEQVLGGARRTGDEWSAFRSFLVRLN